MTTSAIILSTLVVLVLAGYVAYLAVLVRGDGIRLKGRQAPASHYRDVFDATGPGKYDHFDPTTASARLA